MNLNLYAKLIATLKNLSSEYSTLLYALRTPCILRGRKKKPAKKLWTLISIIVVRNDTDI